MKNVLIIEVSPRGAESLSRKVTEALSARLEASFADAKFIRRDLASETIPHLDYSALKAIASKDQANNEIARLSDKLTDELLASDILVIATPMWNFGIPTLLKAWIDLVVRAGRTFNYAGQGVVGLAQGKKAILVLASGGVFSDGPWKQFDFVEPYLRAVLGFIGIEDVQTVRVEGSNVSAVAASAVPNALAAVEALSL
jgi:FMN-dependent NADH-azoreductase